MSSKEARKVYGFENFHRQEQKIMNAISAAESIRKSVIIIIIIILLFNLI
jgi:hypothetical protein